MGQRAQVLAAIEDFLYEVCLLVVFYPWKLAQLAFRPRLALRQFHEAVINGTKDELVVSAPLFLFISATLAVTFLPPVDLGNHGMFANFARLFTTDAVLGKILALCMPVLMLAIFAALFIEWRTPGGVTRQSFYLPLFMSVLVASVLLMVTALANVALVQALGGSVRAAAAGLAGMLIGLLWYLNAQAQVFSLLVGTSRLAGIGYSLAAFALNEAFAAMLPQG